MSEPRRFRLPGPREAIEDDNHVAVVSPETAKRIADAASYWRECPVCGEDDDVAEMAELVGELFKERAE